MATLNNEAEQQYKLGLELLHADKFEAAIVSFSKAIAIDPELADAYYYRGELMTMTGHIVEGNADLQKAKALRSGMTNRNRKRTGKKKKYNNWQEVESIYDHVFPVDTPVAQDENVDFKSQIYDSVFADDAMETEKLWNGLVDESSGATCTPAILEFMGGRREEVFRAQLFQPSAGEVTILQEESGTGKRIVPLRELSCIRLPRLPAGCAQEKDQSCPIEIIETADGNIYHEHIPQQQELNGGLLGFSTKENTHFPYTFFPEINIKLRYQDRYLGDILLEKRFIADEILKNALEEHQRLRGMQLGRIIARQANLLYSMVETTIAKAQRGGMEGLRTGEILLDAGLVNEEQVLDALEFQEKMKGKKLGEFLVEKGILREKELYISLAEKFRIPFIDLRQQKVSKKILTLLPRELVLRFNILPVALKDSTLVVASPSPEVTAIRDAILQDNGAYNLEFVLAQPTHLRNVVNILYQDRRVPEGNA